MKSAPLASSKKFVLNMRSSKTGAFPRRTDTVRADVLVAMLEGEHLTGIRSVFAQGTTRLSPVICDALEKTYGWPVNHRYIVVGTSDGRETSICVYWLSQETIARAFEIGAREWINKVKIDRAIRRNQAETCRAEARSKNAVWSQSRQQNFRPYESWGDL